MHYEILIMHFCVFILTDPNQFQLVDCVEDEEANTSLCLHWQNKDFPDNGQFKCNENKIEYKFKCGKNLTLIRGGFFFFFFSYSGKFL